MACSDAAPPNGNEPSADELSLFPAKRFDPKPGAYVGATFRLDLMQRGGELLANVSTRGDKYEGSSAVDLRVTFFNA